ncbi:MAG: outer membrane lipoprotein carrier protein LolA [Rhodospirillales bacterium]|nr:outer membrane lipoprotein carrier protein LolA [Rhodospirillales bacterium]MDP6882517.1 outer membrane lipoprotein carrier protein LolA [Rhodospirillales bacterium]
MTSSVRLCFVAGLVAAATLAGAAAAPPDARLSAAERQDIARIETYFNGIETMRSRFLQVTSTGAYSEGTFSLWRPGRMRIEYDPPVPILIVADGRSLVYHDKKLMQVSYLGIDDGPAGLLLAERVSLSDTVSVTRFERRARTLRVTVVKKDDPLEGSLTLVFEDRPLIFRKWIVADAQGVETTVSLLGPRFGAPLDPELFRFVDPTLFKSED